MSVARGTLRPEETRCHAARDSQSRKPRDRRAASLSLVRADTSHQRLSLSLSLSPLQAIIFLLSYFFPLQIQKGSATQCIRVRVVAERRSYLRATSFRASLDVSRRFSAFPWQTRGRRFVIFLLEMSTEHIATFEMRRGRRSNQTLPRQKIIYKLSSENNLYPLA